MSRSIFETPHWLTLASGRSFLARAHDVTRHDPREDHGISETVLWQAFPTVTEVNATVDHEESLRYLKVWRYEGVDGIEDVQWHQESTGHSLASYMLPGEKRVATVSIQVDEAVRAHPSVVPLGIHDPIANEFCLKEGISEDELRQHVVFGTIKLTQSLTGPFYEWGPGLNKDSARAAYRTAQTLAKDSALDDEQDNGLVKRAIGRRLDQLASPHGVTRGRGESDESLRARILERYKR